MIRNVIFDFDDTICKTHQYEYRRHAVVAKELRLEPITEEKFLQTWGPPWSVMISLLWPGADIKKFQKTYVKHHFSKIQRLQPGAKSTLQWLEKNDYDIHLITSRDNHSLQNNLRKLGIKDHFGHIHSADHGPFHKPDPRVFLDFLEDKGLQAAESMYVGDLLIDYEGSSRAGITFVAVVTGAHDKKTFLKAGLRAKYIIPGIRHLPAWLRKNNRP